MNPDNAIVAAVSPPKTAADATEVVTANIGHNANI